MTTAGSDRLVRLPLYYGMCAERAMGRKTALKNQDQADMKNHRESDPEIRLKDLMHHYRLRWKSILLVTVLLAAVLGGWQYFSVKKVHDAGGLTKDEQRYELEMAEYQAGMESYGQDVEIWQNALDEKRMYRDHSLLMQLDPENTWAAEKKYLVSGIQGSADNVMAAYTGAMITDHEEAALEEAFGTANTGFINEIVTIQPGSGDNCLYVTVWAASEESARKGLAYVSGKIDAAAESAQALEPHTLQVVSEGTSRKYIQDLTEKKTALAEDISHYEDGLKRAERVLNNTRESKPFEPDDPVVRWAVTGAALGLLLMLALYLTTFLRVKGDRHR